MPRASASARACRPRSTAGRTRGSGREEQERIADRLDRFAHTLRRKLAEEDTDLEQALISRAEVGTSRDELAQYRRDRRSWAERLDQLPHDRGRELAAVARRQRTGGNRSSAASDQPVMITAPPGSAGRTDEQRRAADEIAVRG